MTYFTKVSWAYDPYLAKKNHSYVIMSAMVSQIIDVLMVCSIVCSGADQRKNPSSASLAFVTRIHRWPVNSPHKGTASRKMLPFDEVIMPDRRQVIIWTNAGILLIGPWGTNFSEILIDIQAFSLKKMHLEISSAKWRPCCLGLNVLNRLWNGSHVTYNILMMTQ